MKRPAVLVSFFLSLFAPPAISADPLPRAEPESVGLSSERLARIGQVINSQIESGRLPGMVVAIARKGRLAYFEAFGWRDRQAGVRMTTDTIFGIASMTKAMVAVGTLTFYEQGRLLIGDPLGKYIPELGNMDVGVVKSGPDGKPVIERVPAKRQILIQDLLRHTSGLTYGARGSSPLHKMYPPTSTSVALTMTAGEFIAKLASLPLVNQPGAVWEYSLAFEVIGVMLERIGGKSLGEVLGERIWKAASSATRACSAGRRLST